MSLLGGAAAVPVEMACRKMAIGNSILVKTGSNQMGRHVNLIKSVKVRLWAQNDRGSALA
jgi:hypothetical protein